MIAFLINNTKLMFIGFVLFFYISTFAHPMPNSVIALNVHSKKINCEIQLPLKELQFAVSFNVTKNTNNLIKNHKQEILNYLLSHFNIKNNNGEKWNIHLLNMNISKSQQKNKEQYEELIISLSITPKTNDNIRKFTINYDAIVHQVVTHRTLVTINQDWENGIINKNNSEIGTICIDTSSNKVLPFQVNLSQGSNWKGFKSMVCLGIEHISEGFDHLLFLMMLLLTAPLLSDGKKWEGIGNTKYSLIKIIKIVTAFTFGHSITLVLGAIGIVNIYSKPVEILIAFSILITAIHVIKPIFINKEVFIASAFGLIHGLAFATILTELNLENDKLILSLLGFNIGIELMQLFVIILIMPWLLILSSTKVYKKVRIIGATFAIIFSIAWIIERTTEKQNFISKQLENISKFSVVIVLVLVIFTLAYLIIQKYSKQKIE